MKYTLLKFMYLHEYSSQITNIKSNIIHQYDREFLKQNTFYNNIYRIFLTI